MVSLPVILAVVTLAGRTWAPSADQAIELLRIQEVGGAHTPLVGAYSKYGWNHPGPILFWLSAPGYRLFGAVGVLLTIGLINAIFATLAVVAARRTGGPLLAWLVAAATSRVLFSQGHSVVDPWNARAVLLPTFAFFLCCYGAANGDEMLLLGAVVTGSFAVQAHVGSVPVVLACSAMAMAGRWCIRRGPAAQQLSRRSLAAALFLWVFLWSGPFMQQVFGHDGNLSAIVAFFRESHPTVGYRNSLRIAGRLFGVPAPWLGASETNRFGFVATGSPVVAVVVVLAVLALGCLCWRVGDRSVAVFSWGSVVAVLVSTVAIAQGVNGIDPYAIRWTWAVAALLWTALFLAAARLAARFVSLKSLVAAATALALSATVLAVPALVPAKTPAPIDERAVQSLLNQLEHRLDRQRRYQLAISDDRAFAAVSIGVAANLARDGWQVRFTVTDALKHALGPRWSAEPARTLPTIYLFSSFAHLGRKPPRGGVRLAVYDPLSSAEREPGFSA